MIWSIYLEIKGEFFHKYLENLSREDALERIEADFENGYLTGKRFKKVDLSTWKFGKELVHLFNEKSLENYLQKENLNAGIS